MSAHCCVIATDKRRTRRHMPLRGGNPCRVKAFAWSDGAPGLCRTCGRPVCRTHWLAAARHDSHVHKSGDYCASRHGDLQPTLTSAILDS